MKQENQKQITDSQTSMNHNYSKVTKRKNLSFKPIQIVFVVVVEFSSSFASSKTVDLNTHWTDDHFTNTNSGASTIFVLAVGWLWKQQFNLKANNSHCTCFSLSFGFLTFRIRLTVCCCLHRLQKRCYDEIFMIIKKCFCFGNLLQCSPISTHHSMANVLNGKWNERYEQEETTIDRRKKKHFA